MGGKAGQRRFEGGESGLGESGQHSSPAGCESNAHSPAESVRCYRSQAGKLLGSLPDLLDEAIGGLDAAAVTGFVLAQTRSARSVWSAKAEVSALRALLRFLHVEGLTSGPLVGAVPAVAGWRLAGLPRGLTQSQVAALLAAPDSTTRVGVRDGAVLTLLAGLGLRGAEVAALRLGDIDWHHAEVLIRGKGPGWNGSR